MNNPIIDNRIVSSMHFAIRFKRFVESVTVGDACSEDEKEAMLHTANALLDYQLKTVDPNNKEEINYLSGLGLYPIQPLFRTQDGHDVFESSKGTVLYGLILEIENQAKISKINIRNKSDIDKMNPKRVWFLIEANAKEFLALNTKILSIMDLKDLNLWDDFLMKKIYRKS